MRISQSPRTAGALAVMLLGLGVGCSGSGGAPTVAARVGSEKVSSKKIAALTGRYAHTPQGSDVVEKQGRKELERLILGFRIRLSALNQAAKAVGIAMPESSSNQLLSAMQGNPTYKDFLRQAGYSMEDLETAAKGGWLSKAVAERLFPDVPITDKSLQDQFSDRQAEFKQSWKIEAEIAVFPKPTSAEKFRASLKQGRPFEEMARSLGAEQAAPVTITPTSPLPRPIIDKVAPLKEGELSEPIWSESKSFILQVVHRTEIPGRTFEQVKTELMADASDARRSELFQKSFDARIRSTHIQVSRYYGTWDPGLETVR